MKNTKSLLPLSEYQNIPIFVLIKAKKSICCEAVPNFSCCVQDEGKGEVLSAEMRKGDVSWFTR